MARTLLKIKGRVIDAETGKLLPFTNIRLADKAGKLVGSKVVNTKGTGNFEMPVYVDAFPTPSGILYDYEAPMLVASFVGYERNYIPINFKMKDKLVTIPLTPKTLETVVITPDKKPIPTAKEGDFVKHVKRTNWLVIGAILVVGAIAGVGIYQAVKKGSKKT